MNKEHMNAVCEAMSDGAQVIAIFANMDEARDCFYDVRHHCDKSGIKYKSRCSKSNIRIESGNGSIRFASEKSNLRGCSCDVFFLDSRAGTRDWMAPLYTNAKTRINGFDELIDVAKTSLPTAKQLCENVPEQVRPFVAELAKNVIFMHDKLIETRKGLVKQTLVIPYDNGGGQTGIRENPAFKAYQAMLASYRKALDELSSTLRRYGGLEKKRDDENPLAKILAEAEKVLQDA